jgi:acyl transferase domain-containing protein/NADPH:quinone reductase-like Zn-dependent oxidoreductase/phospholipid N-methyltransferase/acyl carrier protein
MTSHTPTRDNNSEDLSPLKRAFLALEEAEARTRELENALHAPIAIIGQSCRVPGADSPGDFWQLLDSGTDATSVIPADRWDHDKYYTSDPDQPGGIATNRGGFLDHVDRFDANLFGIAPREARSMDPQQRLFLETAWEALESAGLAPDNLSGTKTGVFCGVTGSDYAYMQLATRDPDILDAHFTSGIAHSIVSGRLSYLLGLQGPSITLDTACSSSLVAIHQAVQSLRRGESDMALAGGVNKILSPDIFIALSRAHMLAPDGRCKSFDASADGFARGEGCGVIVLKRLKDAQADGDRVLAVIRGSAINQDGPSSGLTAPNGPAQESVIKAALSDAGIQASELGYLEAHGTGTSLGDPQEMQAIGNVFTTPRSAPLIVGSVKTNIGHLEAAAGVTGVIKLVLMLNAKRIPPHLHFNTPSPHIPWKKLPVRIPTRAERWEPINGRRLASISSFGFSGTNAHLVIEEADRHNSQTESDEPSIVAVAAASPASLHALAARYAQSLAGANAPSLKDMCRTANAGRAQLPYRAVVSGATPAQMRTGLQQLADADHPITGPIRSSPKVAFLFTGQGAQFVGMGRDLYNRIPVFKATLDAASERLKDRLEVSLIDVMFGSAGDDSLLDQTRYTQPALFAIEYALYRVWQSWGIEPGLVIGHSIGEYAAACVAGILSFEDGLDLVAERGRLMNTLPAGGGMISVNAPEAIVRGYLPGNVSVAAVNAPDQTVIAGPVSSLSVVEGKMRADGIRCRILPVSHAFHSSMMDPVLDAFENYASSVTFSSPRVRLISNLTGTTADATTICTPTYWRQHMREGVRFSDGAACLAEHGAQIYVEIGPQPVLTALTRETFEAKDLGEGASFLPSLRRGRNEWEQLQSTLGSMWQQGLRIDWGAVEAVRGGRAADLPTYPFARERHWIKPGSRAHSAIQPTGSLFGHAIKTAAADKIWQGEASTQARSWLADHVVGDKLILPGAALLSMMAAAGLAVSETGDHVSLEDVIIETPLSIRGDGQATQLQTVRHANDGTLSVNSLNAGPDGTWSRHAVALHAGASEAPATIDANTVFKSPGNQVDTEFFYEDLRQRGIQLGPAFKVLSEIHATPDCAWARVTIPDHMQADPALPVHPLVLDGCLQVAAATHQVQTTGKSAFLPFAIDRFSIYSVPGRQVWTRATVRAEGADMLLADISVYANDGSVVMELAGVHLRKLDPVAALMAAGRPLGEALYAMDWVRQPPLPTPQDLSIEARRHADALAGQANLDAYDRFLLRLEDVCVDFVRNTFGALGWTPSAGERFDSDALADRLKILPRHHRLFKRLLEILAEAGDLQQNRNDWCVVRELMQTEFNDLAEALRSSSPPAAAPEVDILLRAQSGFASALVGACDPLELLFPAGNTEANEALYRNVPTSVYYNGMIAEIVAHLASPGRVLRILEIGGGTGGTTARLVERLNADTDYIFSDIGQSFVDRARNRFGDRSGMQFQTLDLERDLVDQGIDAGSIDVVIGANVVHATKNLRETLQRLKTIMSPTGRLVMLEVTKPQRWFDLTVGLTPGWWTYEDNDLRGQSPLIGTCAWIELLTQTGLGDVVAIDGDPGTAGCRGSQTILVASASRRPERWLVISKPQSLADKIAEGLTQAGEIAGVCYPNLEAGDDASLPAFLTRSEAFDEIVILDNDLAGNVADSFISVLSTSQSVLATSPTSRLTFLTRGGEEVTGSETRLNPKGAATGGFAKSLPLELPELACRRIDFDTDAPDVSAIIASLLCQDRETDVAIRDGERYAARLRPWRAETPATAEDTPWHLVNAVPGTYDQLQRRPLLRRAPGPGEIEVAVESTGLNFRDVLNALGEYPGAPPLGAECAGRVVAKGEGVDGFELGDAVVALSSGSFASHVTLPAALAAPLPHEFNMLDGAAFAIPFVTADYCLRELGRIAPGDRVLIHAAAGGVGMAAVQIARSAGAEIYATAGSPEKRALLRQLGVKQVMDSRSSKFADEVLQATGGRGVDLVLNALTGDMIDASMRTLVKGGRFIELGVRDVRSQYAAASDGSAFEYHTVNWGHIADDDPVYIGRILRRVVDDINAGTLTPLPQHNFGPDRIVDAFRLMAQAGHIGKIVIGWNGPPRPSIRKSGTYLVTGGLSGIGLDTVRRLAEEGANRIIATARSAPSSEVEAAFETLRAKGTLIESHQVDVTDEAQMGRLFARIRKVGTPLRGIIHSAGTLSDSGIQQQSPETVRAVMAPKVDGIRILETLSRADPIDIFCVYSSLAAVLGSPTQSNHAGANAALGSIMRDRNRRGLAGLAIDWGPWSDIGAAAGNNTLTRLSEQGISALSPAEGRSASAYLMTVASGQVAVAAINWHQLSEWRGGPVHKVFSELVQREHSAANAEAAHGRRARSNEHASKGHEPSDLLVRIMAAPNDQKRKLLDAFLEEMLRTTFALAAGGRIDPEMPFGEMGLDSLLAIELRNRLGRALGRKLPATLLFESPTINTLGDTLAAEFIEAAVDLAVQAPQQSAGFSALDDLENLSEEELDRLLGMNTEDEA